MPSLYDISQALEGAKITFVSGRSRARVMEPAPLDEVTFRLEDGRTVVVSPDAGGLAVEIVQPA